MANTALQVLRTSTSGRTPNTTASYATNSAYIGAGGLALNMADGILFSSNGTSGNVFAVGQNCYTYYASNGLITIKSPIGNAARSIYTGYGLGIGGSDVGTGTGFGVYLNYNATGNKQLIFADPDNLTSNVLRIGVISGAISIDSLNISGGGTSANVVFGSGIIVQQGVYANDGNQSYFSAINATGNINAASYTTTGITINATAIVPTSNSSGQTLGNTISRFVLSANTIDATGAITGTTANLSTSVNSALLTVGTSFSANTSKVFFGNSISNTTLSNTSLTMLSNIAFNPQLVARNSTADGYGPYWNTGKSRAGGIVVADDDLGTFMFQAHDGNTFINSAYMLAEVDSAPVANSGYVPSRFGFVVSNTTALSSRLSINSTSTNVTGLLAAGNTTITGFANVSTSVNTALLTVGTAFIANSTVTTITDTTAAANTVQVLKILNGSYSLGVLPNAGAGAYNSLTTAGDTTIVAVGNSGIGNANLAIVPWSGAAGGLRMITVANSTTFGITGNTTITGFANVSTSVNSALLTVGATFTANATLVNAAAINVVGQTNTATLFTTTSANLASSNVYVNTAGIWITNATGIVNSAVLSVGTAFIANTTGTYHTGNINAASYTTTGITINATAIVPTSNSSGQTLGNSISRFVLSANTIDATGAITGTTANLSTSVNSALLTVGATFTANATLVNAAAINITGQVNTATFFATTSANVGGNVQLTTSTLTLVGNSTTVPTINVTTSSTTSGLVGGNTTITGAPTVSLQNSTSIATRTSLSTTLGNSTVTTAPSVLLQNSTSQANLTSATLTIGTVTANATTLVANQLGIGTTTMTNGPIFWSPSTSLQYNFIQQGTNTFAGNPFGFYINPNMNGTAATTTMTGLSSVPIFTPQATATVGNLYAFVSAAYLNSSIMSTNLTAIRGYWQLAATAISNTVTSAYAFYADVPNISATSNAIVTSSYSYYAGNIAKGANATQSIGTAYAYYGAQGTGSATNSWNLYMSGSAPNYLNGTLAIGTTSVKAWGTTPALQFGGGGLYYQSSQYFIVGQNVYNASGSDFFIAAGYATRYYQAGQTHTWDTSTVSGTAGAAASFTTTMSLNSGQLTVSVPVASFYGISANNVNVTNTTIPVTGIYLPAANSLGFATNTTLKATLDSTGNFYVGSTSVPTDITSNQVQLVAGIHQTASMNTASTASGTAVTIFAIPNPGNGLWLVQASLYASASAANYNAVGILVAACSGPTVSFKYTSLVTATLMAIAVSGNNLVATQTSGAAQVITATATRFA